MSYTKEPWVIKHAIDGQFKYSPRIIVGPAVIYYSRGYHSETDDAKFKATAEANSRLIAAAPELLSIVERLVNNGLSTGLILEAKTVLEKVTINQ